MDAVHVLGGTAADEHRHPGGCGEAADGVYRVVGVVPGGRTGIAGRQQGRVIAAHGQPHTGDPGLGLDPGGQLLCLYGGGAAQHDLDRVGGAAGELGLDPGGDHAGLAARGQDPFVEAAEVDVAERYGQDGEYRGHGDQVVHRAEHHSPRQGRPHPRAGIGSLAGPAIAARKRYAQRVDARAGESEQGGQHGERARHGQENRGDPAQPHGPQEHLREDQQAGERQADDRPGGQYRTPGGGHGRGDRGRGVFAHAKVFTEPADDQQRVVDGHAQAEHGDDVDREGRHIGDLGEQPGEGQRAEDGQYTNQQRHPGRHQPSEDEDQQHQHDRHGQHLPFGDVLFGQVVGDDVERGETSHLCPHALHAECRAQ